MSVPQNPSPPLRPAGPNAGSDALRCPACGYSLRGIDAERCPECGQPTELARAIGSDISWAHRGSIGGWRAFWRTAWRFAFRGWPTRERLPAYVDFSDA